MWNVKRYPPDRLFAKSPPRTYLEGRHGRAGGEYLLPHAWDVRTSRLVVTGNR